MLCEGLKNTRKKSVRKDIKFRAFWLQESEIRIEDSEEVNKTSKKR